MNTLLTRSLTLIAICLISFSSWAMSLKEAKAQGLIGEKPDGYIGLVKSNSAAASLVKEINAKRKAKYKSLAKKNKLTLTQVEKLAGEKTLAKTQAGHFVFKAGKWVKK